MSEESTSVSYFATVAKVIDDFSVVINKGSADGVEKGQRFLVYEIGEEVADPDTGESLGRLELVRGTGAVTHVQERIATVESDRFEKPMKTVRKIRRNEPYPSLFGRASETVEEVDNNPERLEFAGPEKGDRVRPI